MQLLSLFKSDPNLTARAATHPFVVGLLFVFAYGAIILGATATIISLILVDVLLPVPFCWSVSAPDMFESTEHVCNAATMSDFLKDLAKKEYKGHRIYKHLFWECESFFFLIFASSMSNRETGMVAFLLVMLFSIIQIVIYVCLVESAGVLAVTAALAFFALVMPIFYMAPGRARTTSSTKLNPS